tara:strand:- start:1417 stop:2520 length:1104 start_codon:yes stop_codon:yes gene_type:complete
MQKKILIVTDFYEPHTSGVVTYVSQIIETLKKLNFSITVLTTKHNKSLQSEELVNDIKIIRCKPTIKISRGFYSIELVLKYFKISKNYDFINIHYPLTEIFPIFLNFNYRTILNYHCLPSSNHLFKFIDFYFYFFGIISSFLSKKIIVLSEDYFLNILLHSIFENKIIEVPPYVLKNKVTKNKKNISRINIGYLGRICYEKGLENLIKVSKILEHQKINHQIQIGGDLNDKRFAKYISKISLEAKNNKNIIFLNKIDENKKNVFFSEIDVFILPSINSFEAFGIVQLEAMSYGVPVIASNIKGVRSVILKTNNGYLFEKNNYKQLANKIIKIKNSKIKTSEKIIIDTLKFYSADEFLARVSKMFKFM